MVSLQNNPPYYALLGMIMIRVLHEVFFEKDKREIWYNSIILRNCVSYVKCDILEWYNF